MTNERPLTSVERQLLEVLLERDFPGSAELRKQATAALVTLVKSKGSPALLIRVASDAPRAFVSRRVPVEAYTTESDGSAIHCLLHVVRGQITEIEFHRENGEPIENLPDPRSLNVIVNAEGDNASS